MDSRNQALAELVIGHLLEIAESKCSITEEGILREDDESVQQILAGLLTLHESLEYRNQELEQALSELGEMNQQLDDRVKNQADAILELSTPVIQIWNDVLILPLIGAVDTLRAQLVVEQALSAVESKQASVLIVDITGVPVVDTAVARHLIRTIDAVSLLGARSILTGVSPSNAQTLVKLGVDLSRIVTKGSLQAGLKSAFKLTNKTVVDVTP